MDIVEINPHCNDIFIIDIFIIDSCNFKCQYCYNRFPRTNKKIDLLYLSNWLLKFKFFFKLKKLFIQLIGGEPTLHEDIIFFIEKLSSDKNIYISIFSNFSAPNNIYHKLLSNNKNIDLKLTWHGTFYCSSFLQKLYNIDKLFYPRISVKVMFEKNNELTSIGVIQKLMNIKFKNIEFSSIKKDNDNIQYDDHLYLEYQKCVNKIQSNIQLIHAKLNNKKTIMLTDNYFQDNLVNNCNFNRWMCNAGKTYLYIDVDGNIIPCPEGNNKKVGSIFDKHLFFKLQKTICRSKICSCLYFLPKKKIFASS